MTTERERKKIKTRMMYAGLNAGQVIRESKYTNFRNFLNGSDISNDTLHAVKHAITFLEKGKGK